MSISTKSNGFTLIELIVVIMLVSIMLFFSIPRFQGAVFTDNTNKVSRWVILKSRSLKEKASIEQRRYSLHIGIDTNSLWITHEKMTEAEVNKAVQNSYKLPEGIGIRDVEFPGQGKIEYGNTKICFYAKGYSDKALIHIDDKDNQYTFFIEPFLSQVRFKNEYVEFEG